MSELPVVYYSEIMCTESLSQSVRKSATINFNLNNLAINQLSDPYLHFHIKPEQEHLLFSMELGNT